MTYCYIVIKNNSKPISVHKRIELAGEAITKYMIGDIADNSVNCNYGVQVAVLGDEYDK